MATHNRYLSPLVVLLVIIISAAGLVACQGQGRPPVDPAATPGPTSSSGQSQIRALLGEPDTEGLVSAVQDAAPAVPTVTPFPASLTDQAARGQQVFSRMCGKCHGQRGQGLLAPRLIGDDSLAGHATAQDLFNFVSTYMPADSPGSLKGDDYWAVVGFLLKQNNLLPQNGKALGSDSAPEISLKR